jgi:hypothetical protein
LGLLLLVVLGLWALDHHFSHRSSVPPAPQPVVARPAAAAPQPVVAQPAAAAPRPVVAQPAAAAPEEKGGGLLNALARLVPHSDPYRERVEREILDKANDVESVKFVKGWPTLEGVRELPFRLGFGEEYQEYRKWAEQVFEDNFQEVERIGADAFFRQNYPDRVFPSHCDHIVRVEWTETKPIIGKVRERQIWLFYRGKVLLTAVWGGTYYDDLVNHFFGDNVESKKPQAGVGPAKLFLPDQLYVDLAAKERQLRDLLARPPAPRAKPVVP